MITKAEKSKLINWKRTATRTLPQCSKFLNEISESYEDSWSITYLIKQYFNTRVREGQKVNSAKKFYEDFVDYWEQKFRKEIAKKATPKAKAKWRKQMFDGIVYLKKNKNKTMRRIQNNNK